MAFLLKTVDFWAISLSNEIVKNVILNNFCDKNFFLELTVLKKIDKFWYKDARRQFPSLTAISKNKGPDHVTKLENILQYQKLIPGINFWIRTFFHILMGGPRTTPRAYAWLGVQETDISMRYLLTFRITLDM